MAVIVFDNDDTLMMNEWQYSQAKALYFAYLYEIFGEYTPNLRVAVDNHFRISKELFGTWGIKRGRTAEAMRRGYEEVRVYAQARGLRLSKKARDTHLRHIARLGDLPFDYSKMRWRPGVERTLRALKKEKHVLCLLTSYDQDVFPKKAQFLGIHRFFDPARVRAIMGRKTPEDFIAVSGWSQDAEREKRQWYAVGNGESDILPALLISDAWKGIHLPDGSTSPLFGKNAENDWPEPINRFLPSHLVHDRVTTVMELDPRHAFEEVLRIVRA